MPSAKEKLNMLELDLFRSKIAKIAEDKCFHCAMDLDYCFRWLSTAPSHRNIALCVHPLNFTQVASQKKLLGLRGQIKLSESALLGLLILIETSFLFRRI